MNIVLTAQQKAEIFTTMFQHIKCFTDNVNVVFEANRMYLQSMDAASVSVFEYILPSTWFDKYEHTCGSSIPLGINSTLFFKILNMREKGQEIHLLFDEEDSDKLFIHFTSDDKTVFDKEFELPLMDLEYDLMNIPEMECDAEFTLPSMTFAGLVSQLKLFGDTVDVLCSEEKIQLMSFADGMGKMNVKIDIDDLDSYAINEGEEMKMSFSLNMLNNVCAYHKVAKTMEVKLIKNYPMKIIYSLSENADAKMTFYLAPKINDD
jgi:proliferating cell nuclear antigen